MFAVCHPPMFLWERLLLTFLELIPFWWQGRGGFVHILHQHLRLCYHIPSLPSNGLCLLKDCFQPFPSPVPVGACLAIWAVQVEIARPRARHVPPRGHSKAVGMSVLKLVMAHSAIIWDTPQLLQQRSAVPTVPPRATLPPELGMGEIIQLHSASLSLFFFFPLEVRQMWVK